MSVGPDLVYLTERLVSSNFLKKQCYNFAFITNILLVSCLFRLNYHFDSFSVYLNGRKIVNSKMAKIIQLTKTFEVVKKVEGYLLGENVMILIICLTRTKNLWSYEFAFTSED